MSNFARTLRQTLTIARRDFIATVFTPTFLLFLLAPVFMLGFGVVGGLGAASMARSTEGKIRIVAIVPDADRDALIAAARRTYAPTMCLAGPWASASVLDGKTADGGKARAFVCIGPSCSPPVTEPAELTRLLATT